MRSDAVVGQATPALCAYGCGEPVRPGRRYVFGHSLRGGMPQAHKAAIRAALKAYNDEKLRGRTEKRCSRCAEVKPLAEFGPRSPTRPGGRPLLKSECRACAAEIERERRERTPREVRSARQRKQDFRILYGITVEDDDRMLAAPGRTLRDLRRG